MAAAVPAVTSIAPGTSRRRSAASDGGRAGTASGIAMSRATPIGTLTVNTHRQPASEVRMPPRTTPSADPAPARADHAPAAYSLMHAAAEDTAAGRLDPGDAPGLITATLLAAFSPQQGG